MHDTVIRGATIVDGSGNPTYTGDVALEGGKIAQVGG
jgi:N-acyl-D-aspartate/D-glutamate deacylase